MTAPKDRLEFVLGSLGVLRLALDGLRTAAPVLLRCRGWRARVLKPYLPKLIAEARFGWREEFASLVTPTFHTIYFFAKGQNRKATAFDDGADVLVEFSPPMDAPSPLAGRW